MIEEERSQIHSIRKRRRKWIRHMYRGDSLLRTVIKEKRRRERPRQMLHDWILTDGNEKLNEGTNSDRSGDIVLGGRKPEDRYRVILQLLQNFYSAKLSPGEKEMSLNSRRG